MAFGTWAREISRHRLAAAVVALWPLLGVGVAAAVDFTGPVSQVQIGASLGGVRVRWPGLDRDYFAVGTGLGALSLNSYEAVSQSFTVQQRLFPGGAIVGIEPWWDRPVGQPGLVVATANPDRVLFVALAPAYPFLNIVAEVPLSEDPGGLVWAGGGLRGAAELAVLLPGVDRVAVLADVAGQWQLVGELATGDHPSSAVGADLDGDGVRELVMAQTGALSGTLGVVWWRADGTRTLETVGLPSVVPHLVSAADFNGDGRAELAVARADSNQVVFYTRDPAGFVEVGRADLSVVAAAMFLSVLPDGSPGLCVANEARGVVELLGENGLQWSRQGMYYPGCHPLDIALADIDGDGVDDMLSFGGDGAVVTAMLGDRTPGFAGFPAVGLLGSPGAFAWGDVDGDGVAELVVTTVNAPTLSVSRIEATGNVVMMTEALDLGFVPGAVLAADLTGDGAAEIVALDFVAGAVVVLDLAGAAGAVELSRTPVGTFPFALVGGDWDADGFGDILVLTQNLPEVHVLFGRGDGTLGTPSAFGFGNSVDRVLPLDLNADGLLDVVATDGQNRVWSRLNVGGRSFGRETFVVAGAGAAAMAQGDLDGDGDGDLVVANRSAQTLTIIENTGVGGLVVRADVVALGGTPQGLLLKDFDGDGQLDVLLSFLAGGDLDLLFATGNWGFSFPLTIVTGPTVSGLEARDANGDGYPDIFVVDSSLQLGLVLLNRDSSLVAVAPSAVVSACIGAGIELRVQPDRPGPWTLALGRPGSWHGVMEEGQALLGEVEFENGFWTLRLDAETLVQLLPESRWVRLTVGSAARQESRIWPLDVGCTGTAPDLRSVAWREAPWPNPFNPVIEARFALARTSRVEVQVVNIAGRRVALLSSGVRLAGEYAVRWDGVGVEGPAAAGVYFLQVVADRGMISRKIVLVK